LGSAKAKRSVSGVLVSSYPATAACNHSLFPLPVVPATSRWAFSGCAKSANRNRLLRSIPTGAGAEKTGLASQRGDFVDSLFLYQSGEHFVALGLGPSDQQTSKFALEVGLS
jgi:hypothetical protein